MEYKYTAKPENYAMYAAGGVFYGAPGHPAFPVRLAGEIFRRCLAIRARSGACARAVLYDPCCGGAYHLATLAFFNWEQIERIECSDVSGEALSIAARNLALLSPVGMEKRIAELSGLHRQFGKESHATALPQAATLLARLAPWVEQHPIDTRLFCADATDAAAMAAGLCGTKVDLVFTDIPYGQASQWRFAAPPAEGGEPVGRLLDALLPVLAPHAVVAIAAGKHDKIRHAAYRRLERFTVGKRQIVILQEGP